MSAGTEKTPSDGTETVLVGVGVSPGIAIGPAHLHDSGTVVAPEFRIPRDRVEGECARFAHAAAEAAAEVARIKEALGGGEAGAVEELGYILDAYHQMLSGSRLVRGVEQRIRVGRINAEAAVQREIGEIVKAFAAMGDSYLAARVDDVREIGRRLVRQLVQAPPNQPFSQLPRNAVILADELTPADTALLDPAWVGGFATVLGGGASHTAIMARSLGMPAVVGVEGLVGAVRPGAPVVVDGGEGRVIVDPTAETLSYYRKKRADLLRLRRSLKRLRAVPAITRDGVAIVLQANLELPGEIDAVLAAGAQGIGLLRSEFMYMNRDDLPGEDEQYLILRGIVERLDGLPLTIRTLDAGGDKIAGVAAAGPNPALGLRAIRLALKRPDILESQLAAILRASAHGPVRILLPMVTGAGEVVAVRAALQAVARRLAGRGVRIAEPLPPLGVMIEVPGAALSADALAGYSDFFAIGTNDLTQYTLAIDRTDEAVAYLYDPLHPAVLRLIQFAAEAALRARLPVSVCGEIAGDPRFTALLVGLGIRELSMSVTNIPRVKQRVLTLDSVAAARRAVAIMDQSDAARITALLDGFNAERT